MKRIVPILVGILLGAGIGWYFGYTRPVAKNQRELLKQYQLVRDGLGVTDGDFAEMAKQLPHMREQIERSDEFAAAIALQVFKELERGNIEKANKGLATTVSIYYRGHKLDGNTNLLAHIESYALTNAAISNAIYRKLE